MPLGFTLAHQVILNNLKDILIPEPDLHPSNLAVKPTTVKPSSPPTHTLYTGLLARCRACQIKTLGLLMIIKALNVLACSHLFWF